MSNLKFPNQRAAIFERGIKGKQRGIRGHGLGGPLLNESPILIVSF